MKKTECVAMLLAGGQGSRLGVLTENIAKPAVPFGGKYRIIDFPLSNCINSGITTVGVLTQYQPLLLNDYIGSGKPWDLDRSDGGVHVLPPYQKISSTDWYKGTANAIYQNFPFIERYDPEYVLVLSGDHIYKMDYSKMLDFHKENEAACTIAVIDVPYAEASRFGIMNTNPDGSIYEFEEKPKKPKSTLASMGIYVFSWEKMKKYLTEDENNPQSENDFGKNIIPLMLDNKEKMMVYQFDNYWKDVGTIDSLWEANLDLLNPKIELDLSDKNWRIYSRTNDAPPQYISANSNVQNSLIVDGCDVEGDLEYSILFENVKVEKGAEIIDSLIMPGAYIKAGAKIKYAIVGENAVVGENAAVGESPEKWDGEWGVAVVGPGAVIKPEDTVKPCDMIYKEANDGESK